MTRRPRSVTAAGVIFIVVGCASLAGGVRGFLAGRANGGAAGGAADLAWVALSALAALVGGVHLLRGAGWARRLLVAWMGAHVVLSLFHSASEVIAHALIFSGVLVLLFLPAASAYLQRAGSAASR